MSKFFVSNKIYNERISICKSCEHYFKPTGSCKICKCFMKIKTRISIMECPEKFWLKTESALPKKDLPKELQDAVLEIYPQIALGRAPNHDVKHQMIELYNTIFNSGYDKNTSCGACLNSILEALKNIYNEIQEHKKNTEGTSK